MKTQAQLAIDRLQHREPSNSEPILTSEAHSAAKTVTKSKSRSTGETSAKKSSRTEKVPKERDPNAPKKPANAYF